MNESEVDEVLDTYMTGYILGEDLSNMTSQDALDAKNEMPEIFMAWSSTQEFVRRVRKNITEIESNAEQQASGVFDFSLVARVAERVGEQFGNFQNHECRQIKSSLMAIEEAGTGRVRLSDFWKPALSGEWQFSESLSYLRQLGVWMRQTHNILESSFRTMSVHHLIVLLPLVFIQCAAWTNAKAFLVILKDTSPLQRRQLSSLATLCHSYHHLQYLHHGNFRRV
jgi:hypothetical protein